MTDDKKTPQANESVKELLGEVHSPGMSVRVPGLLFWRSPAGAPGIGSRIGRQEARCSM